MNVGSTQGLHDSPELWCAYCGRREALPADAAARHRHLRMRLSQLERSRLEAEAPLATYHNLKRSFVPGMLMGVVIGGLQVKNTLPLIESGFVSLPALLPLALLVGFAAGSVAMLLSFRRLVAPLMRARPPLGPGLHARCRSCGGDLPTLRAGSVRCTYCGAENLLDTTLTRDLGGLLATEAETYRRRARGEHLDANRYNAPGRAFYLWGAVAALSTAGLLWLWLLLR